MTLDDGDDPDAELRELLAASNRGRRGNNRRRFGLPRRTSRPRGTTDHAGQPLPKLRTPPAGRRPGRECPVCLLEAVLTPPRGEPAPASPEEIQPLFPDLEILSLIGHGGMGVVYKARQAVLGRVVALKLVAPRMGANPLSAERLVREAQGQCRLTHPHVAACYAVGRAGDAVYLVMEYVEGVSLREKLRGGRVPAAEALRLIPQICSALQYAHDRGVVHRDMKPENVLVDAAGVAKIVDFGLAKTNDAEPDHLTDDGDRLGTARYMAPEQWAVGGRVDHRAEFTASASCSTRC